MSELISIITVCYNSVATIENTIESVLSQDYELIEYIIIDGGSSDGTLEIIDRYKDKISKFVSEPDRGIYDAMNKGLKIASGTIVGTLNSDDVYANSSSVRRLVERMQAFGADSVYSDLVVVDRGNEDKVVRHYSSAGFRRSKLRFGWMPAHPTFFVRKRVLDQCGHYATNYKIAADFEMMVRLFHSAGISSTYLPSVEVRMKAGGVSSASLASRWRLNREIVRACRQNGLTTFLPLVLLKIPSKWLEYLFAKR